MSKRRKYDVKNKRSFIIIIILSVVIVGIFSLFIYKYSKTSKIEYIIEAGSVLQDVEKNYLTVDDDASLKIRWNGNYYLVYNDEKINLGKKVIVYNTITGGMKLYGTFYEIVSDGKIVEYKNENILENTTESRFYKLDDRDYLAKYNQALYQEQANKAQAKEDLDKYKSSTSRLSTIAVQGKDLSKENSQLKEALVKQEEEIKTLKAKALKLIEMKKQTSSQTQKLNESLTSQENETKKLQDKLTAQTRQTQLRVNKLEESLKKQQETIEKQKTQFNEKLDLLNKEVAKKSKLAEQYKQLANNIVEKYIDSKAVMLGVNKNEIKNKLPESYTLKDIDKICESLQSYQVNIGKLPFNLRESNLQVQVKTPREELIPTGGRKAFDPDDIGDDLARIAGLKKN